MACTLKWGRGKGGMFEQLAVALPVKILFLCSYGETLQVCKCSLVESLAIAESEGGFVDVMRWSLVEYLVKRTGVLSFSQSANRVFAEYLLMETTGPIECTASCS